MRGSVFALTSGALCARAVCFHRRAVSCAIFFSFLPSHFLLFFSAPCAGVLAAAAAATTQCFDPIGDICWTYAVSGQTVQFNATCKTTLLLQPGWCAFALNAPGASGMAPAEVFWISKLANGTVVLEDRYNAAGHAAPACVPAPVTTQLAGAVAGDGSLTAAWSRPLAANGTGLVAIVPGVKMNVIAAWAVVDIFKSHASGCGMGWNEHTTHYSSSATF